MPSGGPQGGSCFLWVRYPVKGMYLLMSEDPADFFLTRCGTRGPVRLDVNSFQYRDLTLSEITHVHYTFQVVVRTSS